MTPNTEKLVEQVLADCKKYAENKGDIGMASCIQYALARVRRDHANGR